MRVSIDHKTIYTYDKPVSFGDHACFLRPREAQGLRVLECDLVVPNALSVRWVRDPFNNIVALANFGLGEAPELIFHNRMTLELDEENPFDFILEDRATAYPFKYNAREQSALSPYLTGSLPPASHKALDWFYGAVKEPMQSADTIGWLLDLNSAVQRNITYERRDDEGIQTPNETLQRRTGSCRDLAWLMISVCRQLNLAARFVSGYLYVPGSETEGALVGGNGSMHAWVEIFLPGAGWKGFDPTNGVLTNHDYLTAAVASQPEWVNPIQGKFFSKEGAAQSMLKVNLKMEKIES